MAGRLSTPAIIRWLGLVSAALAVGVAVLRMRSLGAPGSMVSAHAGVFVVFATFFVLLGRGRPLGPKMADALLLAGGLALVFTPLLGAESSGVARWVQFGPISLQPGLMVLPAMIVRYGRWPSLAGVAALTLAAAGLALQPDRAMAGSLVAGLLAVMLAAPSRLTAVALAASLTSFVAALLQPDTLPGVAHVEGVLARAFADGWVPGFALAGVGVALIAPAMPLMTRTEPSRAAGLAFAATWLAILAASVVGAYPTPLLGFGPSLIAGYLLAVLVLAAAAPVSGDAARR